jgi:hypothetical protein
MEHYAKRNKANIEEAIVLSIYWLYMKLVQEGAGKQEMPP